MAKGTKDLGSAIKTTGTTVFLKAPAADPGAGTLDRGEVTIWLDEANHELEFRVKYSGGTDKTGKISLT